MAKIVLKSEKEYEAKILAVSAIVRYWEDGTINGVEDINGDLVPCRIGDLWMPVIEIDTGKILNWDSGKKASIHYKVCDQCDCTLLDENGQEILKLENEYVPSILCLKDDGYGDYIIMDISEDGTIQNWKPNLSGFQD